MLAQHVAKTDRTYLRMARGVFGPLVNVSFIHLMDRTQSAFSHHAHQHYCLASCPEAHHTHRSAFDHAPCRSVLKEALASPPGAALGATATAGDRAVGSRLSTIVLQYLRQQHKAACMSARQPVSTLPPLSLVHPNTLPQAQHMLDASKSTTRRMLEGQVAPFGGIGGRRQHRHFVYGRFRHRRSIRDRQDGTAVLKSCSFMAGGEKLLVGTLAGQVRLYQDYTSDIVEEYEAHAQPVNKLQVSKA